jgi:hypothetical protein
MHDGRTGSRTLDSASGKEGLRKLDKSSIHRAQWAVPLSLEVIYL